MLPQALLLSTLAFLGVTYPVISFIFSGSSTSILSLSSKKKRMWIAILAITVIYSVKLGYEIQERKPNYYQILELSRHSSPLEIRQAYKKVSKKYHPDKNTAFDAEVKFQGVKKAYDILMDETQREVYNRFGEEHIEFDPRQDEMKLLSEIIIVYLGWGVFLYTYTIPPGARLCRTWVAIVVLILLALEVTFVLTESKLPANITIIPKFMTEYEFILLCHSLVPCIVAILRCIAESIYIDIDKTSIATLDIVMEVQKKLDVLLHQLQETISHNSDLSLSSSSSSSSAASAIEGIDSQIQDLQVLIADSNMKTTKMIDDLKQSTSNLGSNYYWVVFLVMYGGVYLLQ